MVAMLKTLKGKVIESLSEIVQKSDGFVLVSFKGVTVLEMEDLRKKIRNVGGKARVVPNRLFMQALKDTGYDGLKPFLKNNTIVVYSDSDIMKPLKEVITFAKTNEKIGMKGGCVSSEVWNDKQVIEISKLPGKKELLAMTLGAMTAVIGNFAGALNSIMTTFLGTVEALEKKKESE